ncbi:MAG: patatin-like phospholipase family protein [Solirubrobacteraceae bacterium]
MAETAKILSIDGGGIRGIIPTAVLAEVERRTGRATATLFDLIAGTSTGGVIALALTAPGPGGRPRLSAAELLDLYVEEGPRIFSRSLLRTVLTLDGLLDERYSDAGLEAALRRYLGEARLADALTPVLVTAYALEERRPFLFKSRRAQVRPARDYPMRVVARATSAAPTYFEPETVRSDRGGAVGLVDGGVCVVNPAMSAYAEARRDGAEVALLASLGTGQQTRPIDSRSARRWGELAWARPLIDVVFDGMSDVVDYQLRQLLPAGRYFRLQVELRARDELDDASPSNLRALQSDARRLLDAEAEHIDALCAALTA